MLLQTLKLKNLKSYSSQGFNLYKFDRNIQ